MSKSIFFLNMFPDYQPPEAHNGLLSQAAITAADLDLERRWVQVSVAFESYISQRQLNQIAGDIASVYGLQQLQIEPSFPASQLQSIPGVVYIEEL